MMVHSKDTVVKDSFMDKTKIIEQKNAVLNKNPKYKENIQESLRVEQQQRQQNIWDQSTKQEGSK